MPRATKQQQLILLRKQLEKIDSIYREFSLELNRLKKERRQIIADIGKHSDDDKIKSILKNIK